MANQEGSYKVTAQVRPGTFRLETLRGTPIPRTWHSREKKYKHQCGIRKLKVKRTETNTNCHTSGIGVLIITVLMRHDLITLIMRRHGCTVKRRSLIIFLTVFIKYRELGAKVIKNSRKNSVVLMPVPVAQMLSLGRPLSSSGSLGLYFGVGFFQIAPQVPLLGLLGLLLLLQLLPAVLVLGRRLFQPLALHLEVANLPPQKGIRALEVTDPLL
ncbi:hypothetical protein Cgig2_023222 [Carnegiea gigantea]|uniref:Uncharacterized protein n=1 Tax=Carnegiea gigantea TaxID=171969 RepID=A0A9Q1GGU1_9CARY|nr:hypothetical protein Cgig2_023222 [Carnegiea gigantea]